jgi:hypothetical protein
MRPVVGQLDVASAAMTRALATVRVRLAGAIGLALVALSTMAHVGSPDTFFVGNAGPYPVRVVVRLPGVIPGRAQVTVRITDAAAANAVQRVTVHAGIWNVGVKSAPPPDAAAPVPGDRSIYAAELWFMAPTSYQLFVHVDGGQGTGTAVVPVLALATEQRGMGRSLGAILIALGLFLSVGMLTIVGAAVRESVLTPGLEPDARRRRRSRLAVAGTAVFVVLALWGGSAWWSAEANSYRNFVLYRPFNSVAVVKSEGTRRVLTLEIHDPRWTGKPPAVARFNALMPDHGKLMHLFVVREPGLDAFAHLHPVPRTPAALAFEAELPPLPAGRYRVYGDIVHESGYAQTLVAHADIAAPPSPATAGEAPSSHADPDDSWFEGDAALDAPQEASSRFTVAGGPTIEWRRSTRPIVEKEDQLLTFVAQDASGAPLPLEPYMGMLGHIAITHEDGTVFAHLHPAGSISMAAMQKFADQARANDPGLSGGHAGHAMPASGDLSIPYAFPKPGRYRIWVQVKHAGRVMTAAFDVNVANVRAQ